MSDDSSPERKQVSLIEGLLIMLVPISFAASLGGMIAHGTAQVRSRYNAGPWTTAHVSSVYKYGKHGHRAEVTFRNKVLGTEKLCHGQIAADRTTRPGDDIRIAPKLGTCAEAANAYDWEE